jgi:selenocysteine lyase/cysteine desulfurase
MGMEGLGFVYVARRRVEQLFPLTAGWLSHEDPLGFLFEGAGRLRYDRPVRSSIDFIEGSATNAMGAAALEASVGILLELGVAAIHTHVQEFLDRLEAPLVEMGFESRRASAPSDRSGILSLSPPPGVDVVRLHAQLIKSGVSCTLPDGLLRFSPHFENSIQEVPFVLDSVSAALAAL